jgi:hypothetical protein
MSQKPKIEEIKDETKGVFQEHRTTSQNEKGTIGVSDWQDSKSDAVKQSRERVGELESEKAKK